MSTGNRLDLQTLGSHYHAQKSPRSLLNDFYIGFLIIECLRNERNQKETRTGFPLFLC